MKTFNQIRLVLAALMATLMLNNAVATCDKPPTPIITANGPTVFCDGGSVTLDAGNYSHYAWNTGDVGEFITVYGSQPYCVTVTDANGCTGVACQFVTVVANPSVVIAVSGPTNFCQGGSVTLTTGSFSSYNWSTGSTSNSVVATTTGNYYVTIANSLGCSASTYCNVVVNPTPTPTITGPTTMCNHGPITLSTQSFYSYHWSTGSNNQSVTITNPGNYLVAVTNSFGCTAAATQTITSIAYTNPIVTGLGSICPGGHLVIGTSSPYSTYLWSTGATTATITVNTGGTYYLTTTIAQCTGSGHGTVPALTAPIPNIVATNAAYYCRADHSVLLYVGSYPYYIWNTGEATQTITIPPGASGTYTVTVTSSNGCTGSKSYVLDGSCNIPTNLSTSNIIYTHAQANYTQPSCYYGYSIRISLHGQNVWNTFTLAPNSHYTFSNLIPSATYDWQIRTNCNAAQTSTSNWSAIQIFTTLATGSKEVEEIYSMQNELREVNIYPNPANDVVTISFNSNLEGAFKLRLMDMTGRIAISNDNISLAGENQIQLNLNGISKGVYIVVLQQGENVIQKKLVIQ